MDTEELLPTPKDVFWDAQRAEDALRTVRESLKLGKWTFWVPNQAADVVRRSLESRGWRIWLQVYGGQSGTTMFQVEPARHNAEPWDGHGDLEETDPYHAVEAM